MDDLIGKTIGGYEILTLIGQGGMASVYRARQISMNRDVAIKVLPQQFLNDDTYLQRFEREVEIVAQLEHRNIVPVYDYGEYLGQPYIVMRYLPSGSVDDLINRGPLPLMRIVDIVRQVAAGLDYAHRKGVLHRDLKPSNILLDEAGGAFITDFGIARIVGEQGPGITTQGVVGTPSYMSPEQAQAHDLDGRSDVYALGVMIFEMATGRRPFEADTPYGVAVKQVTQKPPKPRSLNPSIPIAVERVILKALEKDRNHRYQTATALAEALEHAVENGDKHDTQPSIQTPPPPTQTPPPVTPAPAQAYTQPPVSSQRGQVVRPPSSRLSRRITRRKSGGAMTSVIIGVLIGCGLLSVVIIGALIMVSNLLNSEASPETGVSSSTALPAPLDETSEAARRTLVASGTLPPLDTTPTKILGSILTPIGSTNLTSVGQVATATRVPALNDAGGELLYFDQRGGSFEIVRLNLETGIETQLTQDNSTNSYPQASPDGQWVVFQSNRDGDFEIYRMNLFGGDLQQLTDNDIRDRLPTWSPDGEWIYYSSDTRGDEMYDIMRMRPDGSDKEVVFSNNQRNSHVRISPDGRMAVFTTGSSANDDKTWEVVLLDLETRTLQRLTNNNYRDASPSFSPDSTQILYSTRGDGGAAIALMNADGSNRQIIYDSPGFEWSASFSPDGRFIVFNSDETGNAQLYLMTVDGENVQQVTENGGAYASWIPGR